MAVQCPLDITGPMQAPAHQIAHLKVAISLAAHPPQLASSTRTLHLQSRQSQAMYANPGSLSLQPHRTQVSSGAMSSGAMLESGKLKPLVGSLRHEKAPHRCAFSRPLKHNNSFQGVQGLQPTLGIFSYTTGHDFGQHDGRGANTLRWLSERHNAAQASFALSPSGSTLVYAPLKAHMQQPIWESLHAATSIPFRASRPSPSSNILFGYLSRPTKRRAASQVIASHHKQEQCSTARNCWTTAKSLSFLPPSQN